MFILGLEIGIIMLVHRTGEFRDRLLLNTVRLNYFVGNFSRSLGSEGMWLVSAGMLISFVVVDDAP